MVDEKKLLIEAIESLVERYKKDEVRIIALWPTDTFVCAVYQRLIDPSPQMLGRCTSIGPDIADGTIPGIAQDFVINLVEPPGTLMSQAIIDTDGVMWFTGTEPPVEIPADIRAKLPPSS